MNKPGKSCLSLTVLLAAVTLIAGAEAQAVPAAGTICRAAANYRGCFQDATTRTLPYALTSDNTFVLNGTPASVSPSTCLAAASAAGFIYAAMQAGNQCWAGRGCAGGTLSCLTLLNNTSCNRPCTLGAAGWYCGQTLVNSVYQTGGCDYSEANDGRTSTCASDSVLSAGSTSYSPNTGAPPNYGRYLGCFVYSSADWTGQLLDRPTYDITQCMGDAKAKGFPYAGLRNGSQCFYSTIAPATRAPETDCNTACNGIGATNGQYCGGGTTRNSVYAVGGTVCSSALACNGSSHTPPATVNANIPIPPSPSSLGVSALDQATDVVTWTGSADASYVVSYGPDAGNYTKTQVSIANNSTVTFLDPLVFFHFAVAAQNSCGTSANSADRAGPIWSCGDITSPGTYDLAADVGCPTPNSATCTKKSTTTNCLNVKNVSDVTINCHGHKIVGGTGNVQNQEYRAGLMVQNTLGGSNANINLNHCVIDSKSENVDAAVFNCTGCSLTNSTVGYDVLNNPGVYGSNTGNVMVGQSSNLNISSNSLTTISFSAVSNGQLNANTLTCPSATLVSSAIDIRHGDHNTVTGNTIIGNWDHTSDRLGCDDGIILAAESYDTIGTQAAPNHISGVWDAGIEFLDYIHNSTFAYNTISDASENGIGWFYCQGGGCSYDFVSNSFQNNTISQTKVAFNLPAPTATSPTTAGITSYNFHDNSFTNNLVQSATTSRGGIGNIFTSLGIPMTGYFVPPIPINQNNNTFAGNNFDVYDVSGLVGNHIQFYSNGSPGQIIDGGGNHCLGTVIFGTNPLSCLLP